MPRNSVVRELAGRIGHNRTESVTGRPAMPIRPLVPAMRFYDVVLADKFAMVFMVDIALCPIRA